MTSELEAFTVSDGVVSLRPMTQADVEPHLAGEDDEQRHWLWNDVTLRSTSARLRELVDVWLEEWRSGATHRAWGVRVVESDTLVGSVDVRDRGEGAVSASMTIYPEFRGRGYAGRALRLAAAYARDRMGSRRAVAVVDTANHASRRAIEKAGFALEGPAESWEYGEGEATGLMLRYVLVLV